MDSNHKTYNYENSFKRIDEIFALPSGNYEEVHALPDRDRLTFTNGFYANCTAVFVDIRESSSLPDKYSRPVLAKIYRAYLSEIVAILNGDSNCREINIAGDAAWCVVNTPVKPDIDTVFNNMARINSLMKVLNYKMAKKGYSHPIRAGIGASYGRALMIKAGYSGSGINDVVYMGDVVNSAAKLANAGHATVFSPPIVVSSVFQSNLNEDNRSFVTYDFTSGNYTANVINLAMDKWYKENCT